jgi:hypothetical protein
MSLCVGGTIEDFVQGEILINFSFEPKGIKKSMDEIYEARHVIEPSLRALYQKQADYMIKKKVSLLEDKKRYIFSKDDSGRYFWQEVKL